VSPYDFYQYWRNVDDADVKTCLSLLTFLPMDEVNRLSSLKDSEINDAKKILAYEVTKLVHGEDAAKLAEKSAAEIFAGQSSENMPSVKVSDAIGKKLLDVLAANKIIESKGEGRRLISQNGLTLNDEKVSDVDLILTEKNFPDGAAVVRKGKKKFYRIVII
ncbi:MAG: tyrosine--tRNA ligase, partial [Selenomonadaceae bacterium]|nr:tyrosine--tRNA ligase [Selenomonadaceae bacterium]